MYQNWILFFVMFVIAIAYVSQMENKVASTAATYLLFPFFGAWFIALIVLNTVQYGDLLQWAKFE